MQTHSVASSLADELQHLQFRANNDCILLDQVASGVAQGRFHESWPAQLLQLMNTAHNSMRLSSPTELNTLRNIYTICCILRAIILCDLLQFHEAISSLDHAIIIAGAPGKLDLILHLIRGIQAKIGQETAFRASGVSVQKCDYFKTNYKEDTVPSIVPPSFLSFQLVSSKSPFILRDYARDWPAMEERPWRSAAYLRSISGPGRVVPVEIGDDYRSENWKQKIMPWDEFLSTLNLEDQPTSDFSGDIFYLAQHDLTVQFPSLRDDICIPDYVYASLTSSDYPQYRQPVSEDNLLFNTWLGPEGTMSPAHTDPYYNFYGMILIRVLCSSVNPSSVQVVGYKSVWLAPPSATPFMHPVSSYTNSHRTMDKNNNPSMGNTSAVDVFGGAPKDMVFSDFHKNVTPISMTATLGPGDILFFPPGWWHAMRSETTSFSFSIWF